MIPVTIAHEPDLFNDHVRTPGNNYLATLGLQEPNFVTHAYWRRILLELHDSYGGICAYSCHYIPYDTGADTVEHFVPKSIDRSLAYEWTNYRLVASRYNSRKKDHQDVIDPFSVPADLFQIDFPSLLLEPNPAHSAHFEAFRSTVFRLGLNGERSIRSRLAFVTQFAAGEITFRYLETHAPLIAREIHRQGYVDTIAVVMNS